MFSVIWEGSEEITRFQSPSFIAAARHYLRMKQDDAECGYDEEDWCVYLQSEDKVIDSYSS